MSIYYAIDCLACGSQMYSCHHPAERPLLGHIIYCRVCGLYEQFPVDHWHDVPLDPQPCNTGVTAIFDHESI